MAYQMNALYKSDNQELKFQRKYTDEQTLTIKEPTETCYAVKQSSPIIYSKLSYSFDDMLCMPHKKRPYYNK